MKDRFFVYLLKFNLAIVACVFLLGAAFLLHYYGGIPFGDETLMLGFYINIYSSPLWFGLFVMGFWVKGKSDWQCLLFPLPMMFMLMFLFVLALNLGD